MVMKILCVDLARPILLLEETILNELEIIATNQNFLSSLMMVAAESLIFV